MQIKFIKIFLFFLFLIIINTTTFSKAAENKKIFDKKDLLITAVILINPVISVGTIFPNANVLSKVLSIGNLAYASKKGETITESALSQSLNKKCLIENLSKDKKLCI